MRFLLIAFACLIGIEQAQARGPYGSIGVGEWKGGAYTNDKNGAFSHCAAGARYNSGIYFVVSITEQLNWNLGFTHDNWKLTPGQAFPMALTFDGQPAINVHGEPLSDTIVRVSMPVKSALIAQFRGANVMTVFAQGQLFQFKLTQTAQLMPALVNCVVSVKKNGISSAGEFALPAASPSLTKPVAATATAPAPTARPTKVIDQTGTGFVVSSEGHVVTNQHVVNGCVGDITGSLTGAAPIKLRLVSSDETNDLALLQGSEALKEVATIRSKPIHSGDSIVAIGYPFHGLLTSDFTVTTGIVSSLSGILNDTRHLQISAAVQPGNSGGPLLASTGEVVGVVAAKLNPLKFARATGNIPENINFAIKTGALRDFLDNSVVPYKTGESKIDIKTADIARSARGYTMLISCKANEQVETAKK